MPAAAFCAERAGCLPNRPAARAGLGWLARGWASGYVLRARYLTHIWSSKGPYTGDVW